MKFTEAKLEQAFIELLGNEGYPQILFDVFLSIFRVIGKEHYEMMMKEQIAA